MAPHPLLLLQLGAVTAASSLLAASCPVYTALPPSSRDASATTDDTDVRRTVDGAAAAVVSRGACRLGPAHSLRRLSDIPTDAPAAVADYDIPVDAPAASPSGDADDAAAGHFPSTILDFALLVVLFLLAALAGSVVLALLIAGLIKIAALLASFVAGLYAAAKTAREKATPECVPSTRTPSRPPARDDGGARPRQLRPRRPWLRAAPALVRDGKPSSSTSPVHI